MRSAAFLAGRLNSPLHLISAVRPAPTGHPDEGRLPADEHDIRLHALSELLRNRAQKISPHQLECKASVVQGEPATAISAAASQADAGLIVMGIGRHRPFDRLLGAETTLATIRLADRPILALADELRELPAVIVAGTDFSAVSANALQQAIPLMAPGCRLMIAHAWQPANRQDDTRHDDAYRHLAAERFARFRELAEVPASFDVTLELLEGNPAEELLLLAERVHADLLVVGRHGRGLLERILVGSVATRVLRGATCHVFVAPESALPPSAESAGAGASFATADSLEWPLLLRTFSARNAGRALTLTDADRRAEARTTERGYRLDRITFDPADPVLEIVLLEARGHRHVSRLVARVTELALISDDGRDRGLRIVHATGEAVVEFAAVHAEILATV